MKRSMVEPPVRTEIKKRRGSSKNLKPQDSVQDCDNLFTQLLKSSGLTLKSGEQQNELALDQRVFQKTLQQSLRKHKQYPNVLQEFMSGLESHIEDRERFRNCLLPCGRCNEAEEGSNPLMSSFHDSLIKILLSIDILQELLINLLFEKIPEFLYDSFGSDGISIPRLIINQLKWLDLVVCGKELTGKIMQLVTVAPADIQHHVINSLPEILEDAEHNDVAKELSSLLKQNTHLTVPILDAFSNLNLSTELLTEVRQWVMSTLCAVDLEVVPVIVKFILHTVTPSDALEVISELRKNLDMESCVSLSQVQATKSKAGITGTQDKSSQDCVTVLMEVIKSAVWFQKHTCDAWIKAIESVETVEELKVTDFLVLLILYTTNSNSKKQVERVLKNKVRSGCITHKLVQNMFKSHTQVLMFYFASILSLAQTLLRSVEPIVSLFGSHLFKHAFAVFDRYCQQELVVTLVTHICSGYADEVDTALDAISDLVSSHTAAVALYVVFIKGILDHLDNLNSRQIRKLFQILCALGFSPEGSHIQDELHIVIRKQLSSTALKYKRIGVIGAVRMAGSMVVHDRRKSASSKLETPALSPNVYRQVTSLLELARTCCEQSPQSAAFYYDELADLVQTRSLEAQVMEHLRKTVVEDFQDDYVVDLDQAGEGTHLFPVKAMYNLEDDESQNIVVINLLPLLSQELANKSSAPTIKEGRLVSSLCLSPFFRLLRLCIEDEFDGNLDEIDALLGCPLYLTDLEVIDKMESLSKQEREFLCSLLFLAINWFIEVVNAFCKQPNADMKGKVLSRLQNITWLRSVLEKCLPGCPGYNPPCAHFECEQTEVSPPVVPAVTTTKKTKKGKKRPLGDGKNSSTEEDQLDSVPQETQKSQAEKEKEENSRPSVSLSSFRPFFRELDIDVFTVLQNGLVTRSLLDTNMCTKATEVVQLGPAELVFLLEDLSRKTEHILTGTRRAPLLKVKDTKTIEFTHLCQRTPKEVAEVIVGLLNPLCNHVENMHNYFQTLLTENHGVVDAPGVDGIEHQYMASSYHLLLQVFRTLFAWNGFLQHENRDLLKSTLAVFADRIKESDASLDITEQISHSFSYFQNLCSSVPTFSAALSVTQLLITLIDKTDASPYRSKIASIVKGFLRQSWIYPSGERERGVRFNETLQSMLGIYLEYADVLEAIEEICGTGVSELMNATKDGHSSTYPTLTRHTFVVYFRVLMEKLEKYVRSIPVGTRNDSYQIQAKHLMCWSLAVKNFHILVNLIKVFDSRPVLINCLKYGRQFVETFLRVGMPLLDCCFKKCWEDVQSLLKILQLCTRQLHHMCGHSKIHQDTGLTTHVPPLKKTLEMFVYRVKAMLVLNNCQNAFWLGNLKNRDLQGEEILSQKSQDSETEEDQGSQLPAEEPEEEQEDESKGSDQEQEDEDEESD
ncbi:Fanconi anemia group D2 protein isoform X2 [Hyla sarda]|uniref:Fanconi anemia group D2 protein isoform X2 n=1 Tax=Hyla sarda TaxID=327740 RepID=UPI0024C317A3|nr:Fanconi anemia group D2 protein isoform X2 [Hyla sarda]